MYISVGITLLPAACVCPRYRKEIGLDMQTGHSKFQDTLRMQIFRVLKLFFKLQAFLAHNYNDTGALYSIPLVV